jgi:hypothetical protein
MTTAMFDKDRVGYKGNTLPPPSTRNGRETAGVHRKIQGEYRFEDEEDSD